MHGALQRASMVNAANRSRGYVVVVIEKNCCTD